MCRDRVFFLRPRQSCRRYCCCRRFLWIVEHTDNDNDPIYISRTLAANKSKTFISNYQLGKKKILMHHYKQLNQNLGIRNEISLLFFRSFHWSSRNHTEATKCLIFWYYLPLGETERNLLIPCWMHTSFSNSLVNEECTC